MKILSTKWMVVGKIWKVYIKVIKYYNKCNNKYSVSKNLAQKRK